MTTDTTGAEFEAQARQLRPHYAIPLRLAYDALVALHEALETEAGHSDEVNQLVGDADESVDMAAEVMEVIGVSEFFDVLSAIQRMCERYTASGVDDDNLIRWGPGVERREQLHGPDCTNDFDPPWPVEARVECYRKESDPIPRAGETTIERIFATAADWSSLDDWRSRAERGDAGHRAASDVAEYQRRLDQLEARVGELRGMAERLADADGIER